MLSVIHWIVLGVIQGVTEWIPLSSKTAILIYAMWVMGFDFPTAYLLALLMQGSTALAGLIYLKEDYAASANVIFGRGTKAGASKVMFLLVSLVATAAIGIPIVLFVGEAAVDSASLILLMALAFLAVAYVDMLQRRLGSRDASGLTTADALVVGALQGISALPGVSRSGATTLGLLSMSFRTDEALRLSFFTGVIATIGSTVVSLWATVPDAQLGVQLEGVLIGWATGAVVGLLCIRALIGLSTKFRVWQLSLAMAALALTSLLLV